MDLMKDAWSIWKHSKPVIFKYMYGAIFNNVHFLTNQNTFQSFKHSFSQKVLKYSLILILLSP